MSPVILFIIGVVFVAVGIAVSIALHEVGHLVPAKLFKVRVTKYMIGFGPTIWSTKKGETEYGFKALPLGGYVSMIGMYPPNKDDGSVRPSSTGMFQTLATEARSMAHEEVGPGDENRVFYRLPVWKKIIMMLGGPAMNLLIGLVLTAVMLMGFGLAEPTTTIADVSKCQVKAGETVDPDSADCKLTPAAAAQLKPNDVITSFDGKAVTSWDELTGWIRASAGREVSHHRAAGRLAGDQHRHPRAVGAARSSAPTAARRRTTPGTCCTRTSASWASVRRPRWCRSRRRPSCPWRGRTSSRLPAWSSICRPAWSGWRRLPSARNPATPTAPSAWWAWAAWPAKWPPWRRSRPVPACRLGGTACRAELRAGGLQPDPAAAARRRPRGRSTLRGGAAAGGKAASANPIPAPSTSRNCCR